MISIKKVNSISSRNILLILLVICSLGCKTKKVIQHSGPVPDRTDNEVLEALAQHNYDFQWYACETSMQVNTPADGVSAKAYIRVRKDSIIWASVKKYKTEGARTLVTPESYVAINRMDRTYQKGSTEEVLAGMGISLDFFDVQQAIFGNIVIPEPNKVSIEKEDEHYIIKGIDQDLQLKYWINAYDLELDKVKIIDYQGKEINIEYDDYRILESGQKVAFYRHYTFQFDKNGDGEILMKAKKIEIDIPKKTRFTINPRYERVY